jgi:nicotinate-nucleotide adenylyltransferase
MSRLGVFGGTFDPIHQGHLDVASAAAGALGLDGVLFVPANVPPHRTPPQASAPHRFAMASLAVLADDRFAVLDVEMLSNEPSFTTTTLDRLASRGLDTRALFLITGADAFLDIRTWKNYPALLDRCHFVVVSRPDCGVHLLGAALPELSARMTSAPADPGVRHQPLIVLVDAPTAPVSSTDIRRSVASDEPIAGLVPAAVARHIEKHRLYRETDLDLWKTAADVIE